MLTQKKLLLVDEDEGVRKALSLFFESHHCHLSTFENATQALIALEKEPYDVIICEEFLADMDGMDFFDILSKRHSEVIKILITSYGKNTVCDDLHGKGVDYLLMKPISGEEMERTMVRLLKSRHLDNGLKSTGRQDHRKQEKEKIVVKTDVLVVGGDIKF